MSGFSQEGETWVLWLDINILTHFFALISASLSTLSLCPYIPPCTHKYTNGFKLQQQYSVSFTVILLSMRWILCTSWILGKGNWSHLSSGELSRQLGYCRALLIHKLSRVFQGRPGCGLQIFCSIPLESKANSYLGGALGSILGGSSILSIYPFLQ